MHPMFVVICTTYSEPKKDETDKQTDRRTREQTVLVLTYDGYRYIFTKRSDTPPFTYLTQKDG